MLNATTKGGIAYPNDVYSQKVLCKLLTPFLFLALGFSVDFFGEMLLTSPTESHHSYSEFLFSFSLSIYHCCGTHTYTHTHRYTHTHTHYHCVGIVFFVDKPVIFNGQYYLHIPMV